MESLVINHFKESSIVITGGGGYLGSRLAETLSVSGAKIILLDLKFNSLTRNLCNNHHNIYLNEVDITQKDQIEKEIAKASPDYIYHFAALLNRDRDFALYNDLYDVNVKGTLNLLQALKGIEYKGFYYASTGEVYGTKNPVPFVEDLPPAPVSPYSLTKLMAEQVIQMFSEINHKPYTIFRIFNLYGPGMPETFFINQLVSCLMENKQFDMTGGEQLRDFIYIDDLLEALIVISKTDKCSGEIINVCSGTGVKIVDIAMEISQIMGKMNLLNIGKLPYRDNEIFNLVGSTAKLSRYFRINSNTSITKNLNSLINFSLNK